MRRQGSAPMRRQASAPSLARPRVTTPEKLTRLARLNLPSSPTQNSPQTSPKSSKQREVVPLEMDSSPAMRLVVSPPVMSALPSTSDYARRRHAADQEAKARRVEDRRSLDVKLNKYNGPTYLDPQTSVLPTRRIPGSPPPVSTESRRPSSAHGVSTAKPRAFWHWDQPQRPPPPVPSQSPTVTGTSGVRLRQHRPGTTPQWWDKQKVASSAAFSDMHVEDFSEMLARKSRLKTIRLKAVEDEREAVLAEMKHMGISEHIRKHLHKNDMTMEHLAEMFDVADADSSGALDAKEFRSLFDQLDMHFNDVTFERLMMFVDPNDSGDVDWEEFHSLITDATRFEAAESEKARPPVLFSASSGVVEEGSSPQPKRSVGKDTAAQKNCSQTQKSHSSASGYKLSDLHQSVIESCGHVMQPDRPAKLSISDRALLSHDPRRTNISAQQFFGLLRNQTN